MVRKELLIPTSAGDVFAVYTSAETPDSVKPLVIMCHGMMMSGSLNPIRDVAEGLNEGGYDTLRLDFRGNGRSSGSITDMTPLTEVNDLLSVIEYTVGHSEEFGSHGSIVLCGHSLGGLVSAGGICIVRRKGTRAGICGRHWKNVVSIGRAFPAGSGCECGSGFQGRTRRNRHI